MSKKGLSAKIASRKAVVGIVGLGYVGLPLAAAFAQKGFRVVGFDVDAAKVKALASGRSHIADVSSPTIREIVSGGRFAPTTQFSRLSACDAIIICVPTPLRKTKDPDLTFILAACEAIMGRLRKGQLIVLESTTYPGTTREMVRPVFEGSGLKAGRDFHLAFSPERVDPGNKTYGIENTPKVVGGVTPACGALAAELYGEIVDSVIEVSSADSAEMVKLLENTFRAVNIAMVNEIARMCHRLGVDVWEIIDAAKTKPFGFMPFYPGPGLGGHCIPVDPNYLAWKMKSLNFEPRFIDLASATNSRMPDYVAGRVAELLNGMGKAVRASRILILGVAYKPGVKDIRESPALDVMKLLLDQGARLSYHDPFVPRVSIEGAVLRSAALTPASIKRSDLALILTAHASVDYSRVLKHAKMVFDTRNAAAGISRRNLRRL
ncbi:MAG: UDP-N-acetyl-D-glucosamine dehydrogenase [Elusimicrobia bacterium CG1_02_63_36]|nr:MAG: UDP-N-acetyl-D-glucosamine dehydrogenase [Elusimicrobia bacterium CG1_02_63_36]PIP82001.1 MAG: UDP-N-acetyl-D-glucosamine dehydrogenase [Elusimicrobia bacterium CG22_combo_CG10-13_8_21_14_all_63_91]PJA15566.1 MAG: UDP-N-acetyl-D-glucosamine dehydrogenase [Elusimicrobia bacterium CG_4_10_14_0_2_um_filter_63_34]PJB23153.1 MAG: UDP-N-acetyl-D-glucosamine dehydrogenase [Elusimicrobia bacterium CG_4_9_14_3_um_filter_62_55]